MDSIKDECSATVARHPMLDDLSDKATLVLSVFDDLPKDCQMDGLLIIQGIINHAVNKMTCGRVASVRFVPCDSSCGGAANVLQGATQSPRDVDTGNDFASNLGIKQELTDPAWTILEVRGRDGLQSADEKLPDAGSLFGADVSQGSTSKAVKCKVTSLRSLGKSSQLPSTSSKTSTRLICSPINGEKKSTVRGRKNRKKGSCPAVELGKPKVKRKQQAAKNSKMLKNGNEGGLSSQKIPSAKLRSLFSEMPIGTGNEGSASAAENQLQDGRDSTRKDTVEDKVKIEGDGDKETVLSMIPLKMRIKLAKKRWKSSELKKFRCTNCPYSTNKRIHLEYHTAIHTGTGKFMCHDCDKCFTAASSLRRHQRAHEGIRPFECPICGKGFIDLASLRTHSVVHTGERIFKCEQCEKVYTNSANLSRHRRVHTGAMPYICRTCGVRYRDLSSLKLHILKHTGEKPYLCEVCNKQFKTSSDFRRHERTHTGERKYQCRQCDKTFVQGWNLKQHERIHGDVRPWKCDLCPKAFRSKYSLDHHLRSHAGIKRYQCNICYKWFTTKKYLSNHQVLHTFAKPFRCATCGQRFNQFSNLKRHERIHSDERRYRCNVCDKTFKYINSLQYHEGIHTGVRLTCNQCGVSFRCKSSIRRHRCRMELLTDLKQDDSVKCEADEQSGDDGAAKSDDTASTDDYDFTLGDDRLDCESEEKVRVMSTLNSNSGAESDLDESLHEGRMLRRGGRVGFPELKVVLSNIAKSGSDADCLENGVDQAVADVLGLGLENGDLTVGNVISVSISESDGVSYPNVVIKQEICDVESDCLAAVSEPGAA